MTREQQVLAILKVCAPSSRNRAECRTDIEAALDMVASRVKAKGAFKVFGSKEGKLGLRRYCDALRALQAAYAALDPSIRPWFSLAETAHIAGTETMIDREIKKAELCLDKKSSPRRDAIKKKAAVAVARDLLGWWGIKAITTRGGNWERVAKLLADDQSDLHDHVRAFRRSRTLGVKKIRTSKGRLLIG